MLLTFQYQLYNPQSIQKPFLGFFIITATTKDTCPLGERHLNHVIIWNSSIPFQAMTDKTDSQVRRKILIVSPFMWFFLGVSL